MPSFKTIYFLILLFAVAQTYAISPDQFSGEYADKIYKNSIKSMRLHHPEWEISYPVIELGSDDVLMFSFDDIEGDVKDYYYSVIHCTYDWKPSNLMFIEYADGFESNPLNQYEFSLNTFVNFTHYELELPNRDLQFRYSGNYLLVIYEDDDFDKLVCTKRFMIVDYNIPIEAKISQPVSSLLRQRAQKIDFTLSTSNYQISNPLSDIKVVIMQNNSWDVVIDDLEPSFINNDKLVYNHDDDNVFLASNEFRYFNFRNMRILSERIQNISYKEPYYYVELFPDENKMFLPYSSVEDINGRFINKADRNDVSGFPEIESDYAIVKFKLKAGSDVPNSSVHLYGEFTNYRLDEYSKMEYNHDAKQYEKLVLIKQGYYNYRYVLKSNDNNKIPDHGFFEGHHYQTENDYLIFVYHLDPRAGHDKLIGYSKINSVR
jgi:hypothetical protein